MLAGSPCGTRFIQPDRRKIKVGSKYLDFVGSKISFTFFTFVDLSIFLSRAAFWSCIRCHFSGWSSELSVGTVSEKYPLSGSWVLCSFTDCPAELTPAHPRCPSFPSVLWCTGVVCVWFHGGHVKASWIAVRLLGGHSWQWLQKWLYRLFIFCLLLFIFSRAGSVCFASGYEFVEGGSYLKVRKLDAGGNFFQKEMAFYCWV